jgi:hypothetical protein
MDLRNFLRLIGGLFVVKFQLFILQDTSSAMHTVMLGRFTRTRISSQCLKRAWRMMREESA